MTRPSSVRLVLVPVLATLLVSVARLVLQVQGAIPSDTGGAFHPLGVTWLGVVFGAWFGWRLQRAGAGPSLRPPVAWTLVATLVIVVAVGLSFAAVDRGDRSDAAYAALRSTVLTLAAIAVGAAAFVFAVWRRLAWTLLLYAIPTRVTVLVFTWLAKRSGWDTHYTKFGPAGIERSMGETMVAASVAQIGFWVPFTIVSGALAGSIAAGFARRRS